MNRVLLFIVFCLLGYVVQAQTNLVPNPSFELFNKCPAWYSCVTDAAKYDTFQYLPEWVCAAKTTSDYYNNCLPYGFGAGQSAVGVPWSIGGYQQAHTGNAYGGIIAKADDDKWQEYLEARLLDTLERGVSYAVEFYVNLANYSLYEMSALGVCFTTSIIKETTWYVQRVPDISNPVSNMLNDTANWVKISGVYTAKGGERWITIGVFDTAASIVATHFPQPHTQDYFLYGLKKDAYYFIDDVSVMQIIPTVTSSSDTVICPSAFPAVIKGKHTNPNYTWNTGETTPTIVVNDTGTYWVRAKSSTVWYVDTIKVHSSGISTSSNTRFIKCAQPITLQGHTPGTQYLWSNGSTDSSLSVDKPGIYLVRSLYNCVTYYDTFHVQVAPPLVLTTGTRASCYNMQNGEAWVINSDTGSYSYTWKDINGTVLQVAANNTQKDTLKDVPFGTYTVRVVHSNGCTDSATVIVAPFHYHTQITDSLNCQSILFKDTATQTIAWQWDFGDGNTSSSAIPTHPYAPGSYIVKLISQHQLGCYDTVTRRVVVDSLPYVSFTADTVVCVGSAIHFYPSYFKTTTKLSWDFGEGEPIAGWQPTYKYNSPGERTVKLTGHFETCPDTSFTATLHVYPYPLVNIGPDTALCLPGDQMTLYNRNGYQDSYTYLWNTGATSQEIVASNYHTYSLTVTTNYNCAITDSIVIGKSCYLAIPNVFSPNGDGINDYFFPRQLLSEGVRTFHMQVFNRWGQMIFETNSIDGRGWDGAFNGTAQPEGVYVYLIEVGFINSTQEKHTGNVSLLR